MNEITHVFGNVNVRSIEINSEYWFVAKDICNALIIKNVSHATGKLQSSEIRIVLNNTSGGERSMVAVNESGLYSLIMSSRKKEAKEFQRWVTNEVLPSIRKTGKYEVQQQEEKTNTNVINAMARKLFELEYKTEVLEQQIKNAEMKKVKPIKLYYTEKKYTAGELAAELGVYSAAYLNERLVQLGFQVKKNGTWQPTPQYENGGYYVIRERKNKHEGNYYRSQSHFTEKGRKMVLALLKEDVNFSKTII